MTMNINKYNKDAAYQVKFVSRCVPKAKDSTKGSKQHDADLKAPQVRFMDNGGSKNADVNFPKHDSALKVRKIEIIDGKKYKVIS